MSASGRRRRAALRLEDGVQRLLVRALQRRGRTVRAQAYPGVGTGGRVLVRGRVLLGREAAAEPARPATTWSSVRANLAPFLTAEVPHARVRVVVGAADVVVPTDREGYVEADLAVDLPPGRHPVTLTPVDPPGEGAAGTVHVLDPQADLVVVSDVDDTIVDSGIAHGLLATLRTALLAESGARVPLEGADDLCRALARSPAGTQRPVVYLSTSPWNLVGFLQRFLQQHSFPDGPLLLTDWGPGAGGLLRVSSRQHKLSALRQLAHALPGPAFVLVGDSGQQDPAIYTAFALEHPGRVAAVYVRRVGRADPTRERVLEACARSLDGVGVPFVVAEDGAPMLRHAQARGLVRP